ncbi:MAG: hypothetical protein HRT67_07585 [Flavobacteriaceae bacterium]|nr:hypothetical protein [Flavobacteriaceae bacterium]
MINSIIQNIEVVFSKKIETSSFASKRYSKKPRPLLTIYRNKSKSNTYTIDIATFIKQDLDDVKEPKSGFETLIENKILLTFNKDNPLVDVKPNNPIRDKFISIPNCIKFTVEYYSKASDFDFYYFQIDLTLEEKTFNKLEGVVIYNQNDDPETSRGTVTTVRDDDN